VFPLYLDEDSQSHQLIKALQSSGVNVTNSTAESMDGQSDEAQLRFAARLDRALYTRNIRDFRRLHSEFIERSESHAGIILAPAQLSTGELTRRIVRLMAAIHATDMRNRVEFLSQWRGERD